MVSEVREYTCTTVTTSSRLLADYMSLGMQLYNAGGPYSLEAWDGKRSPVGPLFDVICNTFPSTQYIRDFSVMSNTLINANPYFYQAWVDGSLDRTLDIRDTWDEETLRNTNETLFSWRDDVFKGVNLLVGLTLTPGTASQPPNATVCIVNAKYLHTKLWYVSTQSEVLSSNSLAPPLPPKSPPVGTMDLAMPTT